MHARVFDTIFRTVFEANVLKASALIAVLTLLRVLDSLVDRIASPR